MFMNNRNTDTNDELRVRIYSKSDSANLKFCRSVLSRLNKHKARVIYTPDDFKPKSKFVDMIIRMKGNDYPYEYVACHSFLFKISPEIQKWWEQKEYDYSKKSYKYKLMDLSEYPRPAVRAVIDLFYTGVLSFQKSEKLNVHNLLKKFKIDFMTETYASINFDTQPNQPLRYKQNSNW